MLRKLMLVLALSLGLLGQARAAGIQLWANNAVTTLAAPITSTTATSLTVSSSAAFPILSGSNWFIATLEHLVSGIVTAQEIVKVTTDSSNTWTVVRAQESTTGLTWQTGDTIALLPTAGGLTQLVQFSQAQAQGYNYAVDVGTANTYKVTLSPALTAHVVGLPIRFTANQTNTSSSSFNDGAGAVAITRPDGGFLVGGEITAGCLCEVVYDGTYFQLTEAIGNAVLKNPLGGIGQAVTGPFVAPQIIASAPAASSPEIELQQTDAPANQGQWIWTLGSSTLNWQAWNDAHTANSNIMQVTRSGSTVTGIAFGGSSQTGTTQNIADSSANFATTNFVHSVLADSPLLGGAPTLALTPSPGDDSAKVANTAFVQTALAGILTGTVGTNGSVSLVVAGSPHGSVILKWGFHTPGTNAGAGLETITFPVAFPDDCYFAAAFGNRNTTGTAETGFTLQSSLSTSSFQAVVDDDASGNRSALWVAIGD